MEKNHGLRTRLSRFGAALGLVFFIAANGASANNINTTIPNIERLAALDVDLTQAQAAIDAGEYDSAIVQLAAIIAASPDSAEAYNRFGYVHRRLQNFDKAFANYGRALDIKPDHMGTHHYIGEAYLEVDDLEKAEYHLAQLNDICEWGCDDFWKLKAAVELYQANVL